MKSNQRTRYVSMSAKDQRRFRENISTLQAVQTYLFTNFLNREKEYFYLKNQQIQSLHFLFQSKHFQHLCGFKHERGAKTFWRELVHDKVNLNHLKLLNDGTTWQKIGVLEQLYSLGTLNVKVTDGGVYLHADYTNSMISSRHKIFQLLLAEDHDHNVGGQFPFSLRNLKGDLHRLPIGYPVIGVLDRSSHAWMAIDVGYRRQLEIIIGGRNHDSSVTLDTASSRIKHLIAENKDALDDLANR